MPRVAAAPAKKFGLRHDPRPFSHPVRGSVLGYIKNDKSALNVSRHKEFKTYSKDELLHFAGKTGLPDKLVIDTALQTVELFRQAWAKEKSNLPMAKAVADTIDAPLPRIPIANT